MVIRDVKAMTKESSEKMVEYGPWIHTLVKPRRVKTRKKGNQSYLNLVIFTKTRNQGSRFRVLTDIEKEDPKNNVQSSDLWAHQECYPSQDVFMNKFGRNRQESLGYKICRKSVSNPTISKKMLREGIKQGGLVRIQKNQNSIMEPCKLLQARTVHIS